MVPIGARKLRRAPAEKARAQPFSTAPWITGRARGGEMGGRLFPQRARRPFVPNKGDEARQCRKKEPRTVLGRGSLFFGTRPESRGGLVADRQDAGPSRSHL